MASTKHPRLGCMPEAARLVDLERVHPLLRRPSGNLGAIQPSGPLPAPGGQLLAATIMARRSLAVRRDGEGVARTTSYRRVWS
jgi:hypothetical protein